MPSYRGFKPTWKGGWNTGSTSHGVQLRPPTPVPPRTPTPPSSARRTLDLRPSEYSRVGHSGGEEMRAYARRAEMIRRGVQLATFSRKMGWYALKGAFQMQPFSRTYKMLEFAMETQPWTAIKPGTQGEPLGYDYSGFPWEGWNQESDWVDCHNTALPWTGPGGTGGSDWPATPGGNCSGGYTDPNAWFSDGPPSDLADIALEWRMSGSTRQYRYRAVEMGPANGRESWHRHAQKYKVVRSLWRNNTGVNEIPYPEGIRIPLRRTAGTAPVLARIPFGTPFPGINPKFSTPFRPRYRTAVRPGESPATQTSIPRGRGPISRTKTTHFHRLPPSRVVERKTKLSAGLLPKLWGGYSEIIDWGEAINNAIPKKPCKSKNAYTMYSCLAKNWSKIDWTKAGRNIIEMQVEDWVIGKFGNAAKQGIGNAVEHGYYNSPFGTEFGKGYWRNNLRVDVKGL